MGYLTPYVVAAFVIGSVLYTYYEVDREVHRDPKTVKRLKQAYAVSGEMLKRRLQVAEQLQQLRHEGAAWKEETEKWIKENMEPASLERFRLFRHHLPYNHGATLNDDHQILLNGISIYHENVQALIEHDEWR